MGNISIVISVAPAIGPTMSGLILQFLSWRFMFVLVLPIALAALVFGARRLGNVASPATSGSTCCRCCCPCPAFGGIVYGLSQLGEARRREPRRWPLGLPGRRRRLPGGLRLAPAPAGPRRRSPLLDLRAFRFPMFSVSLAMLCIAMIALFGVIILLPIYLQNVRGLDSLQTGLLLLPGRPADGSARPGRRPAVRPLRPARCCPSSARRVLVVTMWRLSTVDAGTPVWAAGRLHLVLSLGLACLFTPAFTTALNPLPPSLYSHGSAILSTLQQVAGAAGTALLVGIMAGRSATLVEAGAAAVDAQSGGLQTAFRVAMVVGLGAVACALFLRNEKPAGAEPGSEPADAPARLH